MNMLSRTCSAICFLSVLPLGACDGKPAAPSTPITLTAPIAMKIPVHGMHCEGCVDAITDKVMKIDGVKTCVVSLEKSEADIEAAPELRVAIETAIKKLGYKLD